MLCELHNYTNSFVVTWLALSVIAFFTLMLASGTLFYHSYVNPTFEQWKWKSQVKYPKLIMVQREIHLMLKGLMSATLCPALSLWLSHRGKGYAYCGLKAPWEEWGVKNGEIKWWMGGWYWIGISFLLIWITVDWFEWANHRFGHVTNVGWKTHKFHHLFQNPTPFAVIADEFLDQFVRALPLLMPMLLPINMDLLFGTFAVFFYGYGVFLHWGYEVDGIFGAHSRWINSAFQHHLHHRISVKGVDKTYHTGFFFKVWDEMVGSVYKGECFCAKCEQEKGNRSEEKWREVEKVDYSGLLDWRQWVKFYTDER